VSQKTRRTRCAYGAEVDSNDSAGGCGDQEERAHGIDRVGKLGARRGPAHEAARVAEEGHPLPRGVHTQHLSPHTHTYLQLHTFEFFLRAFIFRIKHFFKMIVTLPSTGGGVGV